MTRPLVTIAVPSLNHAPYLNEALESIFSQNIPIEVFVADGGSSDGSLKIIADWENKLAGWRSYPDQGQSAAINECIAKGTAPYVCWLNSDDRLIPGGLTHLLQLLINHPEASAAYGRVWNERVGRRLRPILTAPFSPVLLAQFCIISQPGSLIRRTAWEIVGGLDVNLHMAMDYDLWWRLYKTAGPLIYCKNFVAINRDHSITKTNLHRRLHYQEAMQVVHKYYGRVPIKWWLAQPYAVWWRSIINFLTISAR